MADAIITDQITQAKQIREELSERSDLQRMTDSIKEILRQKQEAEASYPMSLSIGIAGYRCGMNSKDLIAAALAREPRRVDNLDWSEDILATLDCLRALGADVWRE